MGLQTQAAHPGKYFPTLKTVSATASRTAWFSSLSSVELSSSAVSSGEFYAWISLIFDGKFIELIAIILDAMKGAGWESWTILYN